MCLLGFREREFIGNYLRTRAYHEEDTWHMTKRIHAYLVRCLHGEEEDTCMSYEEEDTCISAVLLLG